MSETEAIFEINRLESRLNLAHESKTFEALELALSAIRAQEQSEPLTCEGCKLNGLPHHPALRLSRCSRCSRENGRTDNYEPTHAPLEGAEK
jgi:hypothetical protein